VFNYPTLAECYKVAALDGINRTKPVRVPQPEPADDPAAEAPGQPPEPARSRASKKKAA